MSKNNHTLFTVWNGIGTLGAILSLSSLADSIVSWKAYIAKLVSFYQNVTHPVFNYLVAWLPFKVSTLIFDYLVIGFIISICHYKAIARFYESGYIVDRSFIVRIIIFPVLLWPIFLIKLSLQIGPHRKRWGSRLDRKFNMYLLQLMGLILLGFFFLFLLNQLIA